MSSGMSCTWRKPSSLQRQRDIPRHGFVALPAAGVAGLVEHASRIRLVAAEDDCDAHPRHQPCDVLLQPIQLATILHRPVVEGPRGDAFLRTSGHRRAPGLFFWERQ